MKVETRSGEDGDVVIDSSRWWGFSSLTTGGGKRIPQAVEKDRIGRLGDDGRYLREEEREQGQRLDGGRICRISHVENP